MQYIEAGKFIKKKRKSGGYKTQKSFIEALISIDPQINCSESYISLIESGVKSPSLNLLDIMSTVLGFTKQEKGELLLIYKRVPSDFELTVKSNLKETSKINTLDAIRKTYENNKNNKNLNNYIRALVFEGKSEEAIEILKNTTPEKTLDLVQLQERTARIAALSGNYDFAIQAFKLALESCNTEKFENTKANILSNIGSCYFNKSTIQKDEDIFQSINILLEANTYFSASLETRENYTHSIDEYARCCYRIADLIEYTVKNKIKLKNLDNYNHLKTLLNENNKNFGKLINYFFELSISLYRKVITQSERGELIDKALKDAVYFHAYAHCKVKKFDEALFLINNINILEQNWLTFFLKTGYFVLKYEDEKKEEFLDLAIKELTIAYQCDNEQIVSFINYEKDKELKTLWELRTLELEKILEGKINE